MTELVMPINKIKSPTFHTSSETSSENLLSTLLSSSEILPLPQSEIKENGDTSDQEQKIPSEIPILPLRGLVIYPTTVVPLTIGQPRSVRLVDEVINSEERIIGLIATRAVSYTHLTLPTNREV